MPRMMPTTTFEPLTIKKKKLSVGDRFRGNVRRLMREQNISQSELADRLTAIGHPMKRNTVNELLTSACSPRGDWFELMARAFDVAEAEFFNEVEEDGDEE